jgi:hypothetical protein
MNLVLRGIGTPNGESLIGVKDRSLIAYRSRPVVPSNPPFGGES